MSQGKYLSLEEARNMGKLDRFSKEHPSQADGRFWPLLESVAKAVKVEPSAKGGADGKLRKNRRRRKKQVTD